MALEPAWTVRISVPIGARSRRRPFAELRAVLAAIHAFPAAGALGEYRHVEHFSLGTERFVPPGSPSPVRVLAVTVTIHLVGSCLADVRRLAEAAARAHPWRHPVIQCTGPDGAFVWMPVGDDSAADGH